MSGTASGQPRRPAALVRLVISPPRFPESVLSVAAAAGKWRAPPPARSLGTTKDGKQSREFGLHRCRQDRTIPLHRGRLGSQGDAVGRVGRLRDGGRLGVFAAT